jgi:hypothetical protein
MTEGIHRREIVNLTRRKTSKELVLSGLTISNKNKAFTKLRDQSFCA